MFLQSLDPLFTEMSNHAIVCLATSQNDRVTARSMSVIIYDRKFYFQTDVRFLKYRQIEANPNVALCYNNIQIEGVCRAIGHPLLRENSFFATLYKQHFAGSFAKYSALENEMLFEIVPSIITVWNYENGTPYREFYDFHDESYCKRIYPI